MKRVNLLILSILPIALLACKSNQKKQESASEQQEQVIVGNDKDEHGCVGSAGYVWSEVLQNCIRPWEAGSRFENVTDPNNSAIVVCGPDSLQVELFLSTGGSFVLDRRDVPTGHVWNQEDDETFNLIFREGKWVLEKRQEIVYTQSEAKPEVNAETEANAEVKVVAEETTAE